MIENVMDRWYNDGVSDRKRKEVIHMCINTKKRNKVWLHAKPVVSDHCME